MSTGVSERDALLAEIRGLYRQLEALPSSEKPHAARPGQASATYLDLVAEIRTLAEEYKELTRRHARHARRAGTIHSTADP